MPSENELAFALKSGFWRLVLCSEMETAAGGLTGYGLAPYCSVLASFQAFIDLKDEQTAQVVEVVANSNLGMSNVAALKGTWAKGGEGDSSTDERTTARSMAAHLSLTRRLWGANQCARTSRTVCVS